MEVGTWGGRVFEVSPAVIRSFTDLTVKGGCETEDKEGDGEKYVERKNAKALDVSMTVVLSRQLGCDVRREAMAFIDDATEGKTDYLYIGGEKLFAPAVMLTEADVSKIDMAPGGTWVSCEIKLTFKQSEKKDAEGSETDSGDDGDWDWNEGGSGSGSKKASAKTGTQTTAYKAGDDVDAISMAAPSIKMGEAIGKVMGVVNTAKETSKASANAASAKTIIDSFKKPKK